jgi:hypothetical protein
MGAIPSITSTRVARGPVALQDYVGQSQEIQVLVSLPKFGGARFERKFIEGSRGHQLMVFSAIPATVRKRQTRDYGEEAYWIESKMTERNPSPRRREWRPHWERSCSSRPVPHLSVM